MTTVEITITEVRIAASRVDGFLQAMTANFWPGCDVYRSLGLFGFSAFRANHGNVEIYTFDNEQFWSAAHVEFLKMLMEFVEPGGMISVRDCQSGSDSVWSRVSDETVISVTQPEQVSA